MSEQLHPPPSIRGLIDVASGVRSERRIALHALHVLEYALNAPAPRRHRTWIHRVSVAVDALKRALDAQLHSHDDDSLDLLAEVALSDPGYAIRIQRLRQELLDLSVAVASLREQIEPDPAIDIDPADIRDRLATITHRFRQHQAREADLVYEATGIDLDDDTSKPANARTEAPADAVAAIAAGGDIVGTSEDDEPLVEGPNSK